MTATAIAKQEMGISETANLLMSSIKDIYDEGFIPSMRKGSTGIGFTLEALLGIKANNSQDPDFRGIELKSSRLRAGKLGPKAQLFTKTPDWDLSHYSAWGALTKFGYSRNEIDCADEFANYCLRCTMDSKKQNPQGFILDVRIGEAALWAQNLLSDEDVFLWGMNQLKEQFIKKHNETFWVGAEVQKDHNQLESFRYTNVVHTKKPSIASFERLLTDGGISVDLTMKVKNIQNQSVRDHGYLFKIKKKRFEELFPVIQSVSFTNGA